ncbi:MAG: sulfotransferase family 2 domain-containing protein [Cyanobacteria bacterium J06650_10]
MVLKLSEQEALVFMHVPKTGGTTLHDILIQHFNEDEVCPERFNHLGKMSTNELIKYRFYSGHYDRKAIELIEKPKKIITILREPKSRILSLYYYWKAHRWEPIEEYDLGGPRIAKRLNLLEFLRYTEGGIPENIGNIQTRTLLGNISKGAHIEYPCPPNQILEKAIEALESLFCFGIMEEYESTMRLFCRRLEFSCPAYIRKARDHTEFGTHPLMEAVEQEEITPEIEQALKALTQFDAKLYQYAKTAFAQRISELA